MDVEREYTKNSDIKRQDVQIVLDWASKQPHLPKLSEYLAILFLVCSKGRIEVAKVTIDRFFTARTHFHEFFQDRDIESPRLLAAFDSSFLIFLPKENPDGCRVFLGGLRGDKNYFDHDDVCKIFIMNADVEIHLRGNSKGLIFVIDAKKCMNYLQEFPCSPIRQILVLNPPSFFESVLAIFSPFIKQKILDRIKLLDRPEDICQYLDRSVVPKNYGGDEKSIDELCDDILKSLRDNKAMLADFDKNYRVNEELREKEMPYSDMCGVAGTFRKLEID